MVEAMDLVVHYGMKLLSVLIKDSTFITKADFTLNLLKFPTIEIS